jgi:diacylglycerol kinase (ATP)
VSATRVAVIAHAGKTFGGGLEELRDVLAKLGFRKPIWCEVPKSSAAPKAVRRVVKKGATVVFVWGGDGMVQRCIDALAGSGVTLAIIPAGTANLLASNLGIPRDIAKAVRIGLRGKTQAMDVGVMNGERFGVMAGTGFDALVMREVDSAQKETLGRLAYVRSAVNAMHAKRVHMKIRVDGTVWFEGKASSVLLGNVGTAFGNLKLFPGASPTDGLLEVGVVTANSAFQWLRVFSRVAAGHLDRSPFIQTTKGKKITIELDRKAPFELDGGARAPTKRLKVRIDPGAINISIPRRAVAKPATRKSQRARRPRSVRRKPEEREERRQSPELSPLPSFEHSEPSLTDAS